MSKIIRPNSEDSTITEWMPPVIEKDIDAFDDMNSELNINSNFIDIDFSKNIKSDKLNLDEELIKNRDQGYDDGYKIGKYEAETLLESNVEEHLTELKNNLAKLHDPLNNVELNVEKELAELAILIAEKMIMDHIRHKPETIINLVSEAIKLLPSKNIQLTIRINPEDLQFINEHMESMEDFKCKFVEDTTLQRGGMLLQSDDINMDLSLEKRMHDLINQFFDGQ